MIKNLSQSPPASQLPSKHKPTAEPSAADNAAERFKCLMSNDSGNTSVEHLPAFLPISGFSLVERHNNADKLSQLTTVSAQSTQLITQLADRILADVGKTAEQSQVRLHVASEQLGSTEIRLQRDSSQLQVQIITSTMEAEKTVNDFRGTLQQTLQDKLSALSVSVDVMAQQQDHRDGRSKNAYILLEADEPQSDRSL